MARSINPLAQLVTNVSAGIESAISEARAVSENISTRIEQANLDERISRLSGGVNSGLNQAAAQSLRSPIDPASLGEFAQGAGDIVSGLGDVISSPVGSGALSSAADAVGSLQNIARGAGQVADITSAISKLSGGNLAGGLSNFASGISKAAGALNNILSLKRGANIPKGGELFATTGEAIQIRKAAKNDWRVKIDAQWNLFDSPMFEVLRATGGVAFPVLPEVTLSTKANYTQIDPVHNNYPFQAYKNSQVDEISINGTFPIEDETDAAYWIAATTFFKTATKMFFGRGSNAGNPPIICSLSGYGASVFENIPIVVKSFTVDFPTDVNYIKCTKWGTETWVPITSSIQVGVQPIYNRRNLRQFSLEDYAKGNLRTPSGMGYL